MNKLIRVNHSSIYYTGLVIMIISLPLSQFALSVGQFLLAGNWLLERNFKNKFRAFFSNRAALMLVSFYLLHVIGVIYTTDLNYALKDLRIKLPLFIMPIIIATTQPLSSRKTDLLLWLFIGAGLSATVIGYGVLIYREISDIREISPFISHIRLSLNLCLAIFFLGHFLVTKYSAQIKYQIIIGLCMIWLIAYLIFSESATGVFVLIVTSFILVIWFIIQLKERIVKIIVITIALLIPIVLGSYLYFVSRDYLIPDRIELKNLEYYTPAGNTYFHDTIHYSIENGSFIGLYVCDTELHEGWKKRSDFDYLGKDKNGHYLKMTLMRYLNSKGLRKDAAGMNQLSDIDIRNIEMGIANYHYAKKFSLNARIYKFLWEYQTMKIGSGPGGLSLVQRFEYWKAASGIIRENFWFGVGTGDMDEAFSQQYEKMKTQLQPEFRHRSHNQFLAIFTAFGIFGLLWFVVSLFYPPFQLKAFRNFRYFTFFVVIVLSMMFEDTMETQMGATLFAFFNTFLLFGYKDDTEKSIV
jgi:hypothetical protein